MKNNQNENSESKIMGGQPGTQAEQITKFAECGLEEKVERLHIVIKQLQVRQDWAATVNRDLRIKIDYLENHQHSTAGDVMMRVRDVKQDIGTVGYHSGPDILA